MTSESDHKSYSLGMLEEWIEDALSSEATPQEIYDTIVNTIQRSANYHRACLNHSAKLLSLLEDNVVVNDTADNVVKLSDVVKTYNYTEKDYWEGNVSGSDFNDALNRYGYEYTTITEKDIDLDIKPDGVS